MIKRVFFFLVIVILLFLSSYFVHDYLISDSLGINRFNLIFVYLFHVISCSLIYILMEGLLRIVPNDLGYLYLGATMVKMGIFILLFQEQIFNEIPLSKVEKVILVVPFFIFLITEIYFVFRILNSTSFTQEKKV